MKKSNSLEILKYFNYLSRYSEMRNVFKKLSFASINMWNEFKDVDWSYFLKYPTVCFKFASPSKCWFVFVPNHYSEPFALKPFSLICPLVKYRYRPPFGGKLCLNMHEYLTTYYTCKNIELNLFFKNRSRLCRSTTKTVMCQWVVNALN